MQSGSKLSELYSLYTNGELEKKEFEGRVFHYLLTNHKRYHVFREKSGRWDDFLSWFYPHLVRAIELYRDLGSSFDTYVSTLIYRSAREYRRREAEHYVTEYACWQAKAQEMLGYENEGDKTVKHLKLRIPKDIRPRQILFLLLKSYHFVTEEFVDRTAETIGIDSEILWTLIDVLKERCSDKELQVHRLRERVHCQHYRCLVFQKRMDSLQQGSLYHERLKNRLERARRRFNAMKKRLGGIRMTASNRMIAEVLGIPKGTVDSGLHSMKKYLAPDRNRAV